MILISYLMIGMFAGTLSGLLGIGGGLIVVPALVFLFKHNNAFDNEIIMHVAVGTSLAIMIFTASSAARAYYKRNFIVWPLFLQFSPGLCLGMLCGALVSRQFSSDRIIVFFAIFLIFIAFFLIFYKQNIVETQMNSKANLTLKTSKRIFLIFSSIIIGLLSTIFGIGGGMLMVPFFLLLGLNIREASGSSAMCGVLISIIGTVILTIIGSKEHETMLVANGTVGFIYWPAVLMIASASVVFAPIGTKISIYFKPDTLKKILSGILILTAAQFLIDRIF